MSAVLKVTVRYTSLEVTRIQIVSKVEFLFTQIPIRQVQTRIQKLSNLEKYLFQILDSDLLLSLQNWNLSNVVSCINILHPCSVIMVPRTLCVWEPFVVDQSFWLHPIFLPENLENFQQNLYYKTF